MKFKRPKITTMLTVFALIIYGGVLLVNIQTSTIEGESVNNTLALEAARLEVEVAELEFAIMRYMAYESRRQEIADLRIAEIEIEERIRELELALANTAVTERNEDGLIILQRNREDIEADILRAEADLIRLQAELDMATEHFNAVDVASIIAEIAREHLGLVLPGEIILNEGSN